jgi:hypothetical protein
MKKYITILALCFAISIKAQSIDTVKSAIQVKPVVFNAMQKDTLYQLTVNVFDLKVGDSTVGCNSYVQFYDRKAKQIGAINVPITKQVVNAWGTSDKAVEDFILLTLGLTRK